MRCSGYTTQYNTKAEEYGKVQYSSVQCRHDYFCFLPQSGAKKELSLGGKSRQKSLSSFSHKEKLDCCSFQSTNRLVYSISTRSFRMKSLPGLFLSV